MQPTIFDNNPTIANIEANLVSLRSSSARPRSQAATLLKSELAGSPAVLNFYRLDLDHSISLSIEALFRFICMDRPCVIRKRDEAGVRSCVNVSGLVLELVLRAVMELRAI